MDLQYAQAQLDDALEKYEIARASQSYGIGGRSISHHELSTLRDEVTYWNRIVNAQKGVSNVQVATWT